MQVFQTAANPADPDGDGIHTDVDNCPVTPDAIRLDTGADGIDDGCGLDEGSHGHAEGTEIGDHGTNPPTAYADGNGMAGGDEVRQGFA